jgi:hypothetical protein
MHVMKSLALLVALSSVLLGCRPQGEGCQKDTDCKGARVCKAQVCVDSNEESSPAPPTNQACTSALTNWMRIANESSPLFKRSSEQAAKVYEASVQRCNSDEWSKEVLQCIASSKAKEDALNCTDKLTAVQMTAWKMVLTSLPPNRNGQLEQIVKHVKSYWIAMAQFPPTAKPLPGSDGGACAITTATNVGKFDVNVAAFEADLGWKQMGFAVSAPALFTYHWTAPSSTNGAVGTALAVGDIDCDGTLVTYKVTLTNVSGTLEEKYFDPTPD